MFRNTETGAVVFQCFCGVEEEGGGEDALIASDILTSSETAHMYQRLLANAARDRVNQQVSRVCEDCGLDYMTQVRLGVREVIVWTCKCGHRTDKPPQEKTPPASGEPAETAGAP